MFFSLCRLSYILECSWRTITDSVQLLGRLDDDLHEPVNLDPLSTSGYCDGFVLANALDVRLDKWRQLNDLEEEICLYREAYTESFGSSGGACISSSQPCLSP